MICYLPVLELYSKKLVILSHEVWQFLSPGFHNEITKPSRNPLLVCQMKPLMFFFISYLLLFGAPFSKLTIFLKLYLTFDYFFAWYRERNVSRFFLPDWTSTTTHSGDQPTSLSEVSTRSVQLLSQATFYLTIIDHVGVVRTQIEI